MSEKVANERVTIFNQYLDIGCWFFFSTLDNWSTFNGPFWVSCVIKADQYPITICEKWSKSSMWLNNFHGILKWKPTVSKEIQSSMLMKNFQVCGIYRKKRNKLPEPINELRKLYSIVFILLIFDQNKSQSIEINVCENTWNKIHTRYDTIRVMK